MCTAEPYYFLVNDTALASDNTLRFRKNLLKWINNRLWLLMISVKIKKLQYDISRKSEKISVLSSGKIDKYE